MVERPASVVKELVENALDAAAREIRVELEGGGKRRIRVVDDGCGMGGDDALLAFDRHATSKIGRFEDLERVSTLGFRGEALAAIAAVARVELRTAESPGEGQRVRIDGGKVRAAEPAAHPRGTAVDVASLFFNVPARRAFLKSAQTELRRAVEVVQGYALARPDVRFSLLHDGRSLLEAPPAAEGQEGARERIRHLFGPRLADALVAIAGEPSISGFVGDPSTARTRRAFAFVNRRLLRDRAVLATFYRAVRETWRSEEFPALFLFLDPPTGEVDVNVHPQKAEVRFRDSALLDRVAAALRRALEAALGESQAPGRIPTAAPGPAVWAGLGGRPAPPVTAAGSEVREPMGQGMRLAAPAYAPIERAAIALSGRWDEPRPFRLLGQYKGTLILLEGPDGLYLVDQHVAHERILYERLRRDLERERPPSQGFLDPLLLETGPAERLRLAELSPRLEELGFGLQALSGGTLALTAAPPSVAPAEAEALLLALVGEDEQTGGAGRAALRDRVLGALAAGLACREAVKMHHPLNADQMEALISELFQAEQPYACPHGRPIVLQMTDADLERRFGRR